MFNYAIYGSTPGAYPLNNVWHFNFNTGLFDIPGSGNLGPFTAVVQPPGFFNLAHVYPTSKIRRTVDEAWRNWNWNWAQDLWVFIDWLYWIDPQAFVKEYQDDPAFPAVPAVKFTRKIFL